VPGEGFEPPTFGLQNRCTTTVLTRRRWRFYHGKARREACSQAIEIVGKDSALGGVEAQSGDGQPARFSRLTPSSPLRLCRRAPHFRSWRGQMLGRVRVAHLHGDGLTIENRLVRG
jgi:hypothetical protein